MESSEKAEAESVNVDNRLETAFQNPTTDVSGSVVRCPGQGAQERGPQSSRRGRLVLRPYLLSYVTHTATPHTPSTHDPLLLNGTTFGSVNFTISLSLSIGFDNRVLGNYGWSWIGAGSQGRVELCVRASDCTPHSMGTHRYPSALSTAAAGLCGKVGCWLVGEWTMLVTTKA
jgi:hypothetical protein